MDTPTERIEVTPGAPAGGSATPFAAELRELAEARDATRARARFREAVHRDPRVIDPDCVEPLVALLGAREAVDELRKVARILVVEGRPDHAAAVLTAVLEGMLAPCPETLAELGDAEAQAGRSAEARRRLAQSFAIYGAQGRMRARLDVARRLVPLAREPHASMRLLACIRLERGDVHRALHALSPLLAERPRDRVGLELLARALRALGHAQAAADVLRRLIDDLRARGRRDALAALVRRARTWPSASPHGGDAAGDSMIMSWSHAEAPRSGTTIALPRYTEASRSGTTIALPRYTEASRSGTTIALPRRAATSSDTGPLPIPRVSA